MQGMPPPSQHRGHGAWQTHAKRAAWCCVHADAHTSSTMDVVCPDQACRCLAKLCFWSMHAMGHDHAQKSIATHSMLMHMAWICMEPCVGQHHALSPTPTSINTRSFCAHASSLMQRSPERIRNSQRWSPRMPVAALVVAYAHLHPRNFSFVAQPSTSSQALQPDSKLLEPRSQIFQSALKRSSCATSFVSDHGRRAV